MGEFLGERNGDSITPNPSEPERDRQLTPSAHVERNHKINVRIFFQPERTAV